MSTGAPAFTFRFALPGQDLTAVGLSRLREDIGDWQPFWKSTFLPFFYRSELEHFVTEGGSTGPRFAPLSLSYALWKRRHAPGRGILQRWGALKASLTSESAPDAIVRMTTSTLDVGTGVSYARYHQFGTRRMPARPPMRVSPAFMAVVGAEMNRYVETIRKARLAAAKAT